jgi:hypothetical protein
MSEKTYAYRDDDVKAVDLPQNPYEVHMEAAGRWLKACENLREAKANHAVAGKKLAEAKHNLIHLIEAADSDPTEPKLGAAGQQGQKAHDFSNGQAIQYGTR